ncbi:MAG: DUF1015 domain-containing protein [Balneolaceae bacterium]
MAIIHPFQGWLPKPELAKEISSVPYDVISTEEAKELAEGAAESFLHVIRPEIDLPSGIPFNDDSVYEKGAENLQALLSSSSMVQDDHDSIYIYELQVGQRAQIGVFTTVSVEDYDNDVILKHELTRPDKEDDRTRHILTQSAHAEPVMLTFRDTAGISELMSGIMKQNDPRIDFTADDGVRHRIWRVQDGDKFTRAFAGIPRLYVADGHHRCKSASRVAEELRKENGTTPGEEEYDFFPAVLFPMDQMKILPYNRILLQADDKMVEDLKSRFTMKPNVPPAPQKRGEVSIYYRGVWYGLSLPDPGGNDAVASLDVARLQNFILKPVFGIENPRTDSNIDFVGGIRGTGELEKRVDMGRATLAFSMYPTSIEELVEVSDQGLLMPPKSTWFEPKLRSGLVIHAFEKTP